MQSITDLLVKSDSITSPGAHKWMLRSNTSSRLVVPPKAQKVVGWENSQGMSVCECLCACLYACVLEREAARVRVSEREKKRSFVCVSLQS
jgi:hypothetical protein